MSLNEVQPLEWRHNERNCILNHLRLDYSCKKWTIHVRNGHSPRRRSKKITTLRLAGLCEWISPVTDEFPSQRASNAENVSIWWRHHERSKKLAPSNRALGGNHRQPTICLCKTRSSLSISKPKLDKRNIQYAINTKYVRSNCFELNSWLKISYMKCHYHTYLKVTMKWNIHAHLDFLKQLQTIIEPFFV